MDLRSDPPEYKPRRARGTPALKVGRLVSLGVLLAGCSIGLLEYYSPTGGKLRRKLEAGLFADPDNIQVQKAFFSMPMAPRDAVAKTAASDEKERLRR